MHTRLALGLAIAASASVLPLTAAAHEDSLPVGEAAVSSAQVVVRDGDTGKLRAATPEEHAALQAQRAARRSAQRSPSSTQTKFHATGATGVRLTDDFMSYSVVTRGADGKLAEFCVSSKDAADAIVQNGAASAATTALPTE